MKKLRTKCIICNHRYVERKDWKTDRENETCMTCIILEESIKAVLSSLEFEALMKGLELEYNFTLKPRK